LKCAHMTYLQLALYGVPAVVIHGNTLTCEEFSRWYTPVYLMNGWIWRFSCGIAREFCVEDEMIKCALEPSYAIMRQVQALFRESESESNSAPEPPEAIKTTASDPTPAVIEQKPYDVDFDAVRTSEPSALKSKKPKVADGQLTLFDL